MKIFEFAHLNGITDWVFAPDLETAMEFYLNYTGCGDFTDCKITDIPEDEWKNSYILDIDEPAPDEDEDGYDESEYACGYKIEETFEEYAARNHVTDMIATTEF